MAAKFEVYIVSGNYLSIQLCQAIFPHVGEIQFSGTCTVWDSWQPTKEIRVYLQDDKEMEACLSSGKILHFYGAAGPHMIGARQYFEYGVFCTELWIDTSRLPDLDTVADGLFCREIDGLFCRSSPDIIVRRRCVLSHKRRGWLQPSPSFRYSRNLALQDELYHPVINNGPAVLVCVDKRLGTGPVNQSRDAG